MTKQPGPAPAPVVVHTLHLNGNELVYVGQRTVTPHMVTLGKTAALGALRQGYAVHVHKPTMERVKDALKAQGVVV